MQQTSHYFDSTGDAYDACQCDEGIKDGDTLVILNEQVVGLAYTWPVAITVENGALHTTKDDKPVAGVLDIETKEPVFKPWQVEHAKQIARLYGFAVRAEDQ